MSLEAFDAEWARCSPWLESALSYGRGTHLLSDVREMVLQGDAEFWPGERSAVVTEIRSYPRMRELHVWLCGGDMAELIGRMLPRIEAHAILNGCARITTAGRDGWQRVLAGKGFQPHWHCCAKEFTA